MSIKATGETSQTRIGLRDHSAWLLCCDSCPTRIRFVTGSEAAEKTARLMGWAVSGRQHVCPTCLRRHETEHLEVAP